MNPEELYKSEYETVAVMKPKDPTEEVISDAVEPVEPAEEEVSVETTTEEESVTDELTMKDLSSLVDFVNVESAKTELNSSAKELETQQNKMAELISGGEENRDFLNDKLAKMTLDECEAYLKSDKNVEQFFINQETGEEIVIDIDFESKEKEIDFKRGLLVYLKSSQEALAKIDEEYQKLDEATREMNMNVKEVCKELSDNTLAYIHHMKEKANNMVDEKAKANLLETMKYIESGYTMEVFKDVIVEHPSVGEKCAKELTKEADVARIGKRYNTLLKRHNVKASLIPFTSDSLGTARSFEEQVLIEGDQYTVPDLFVYSLIRYFAMADWDNDNVRKAHASIILVIKRLLANDFDEAVKADIIDSVIGYLKMFKV